MNFLSSPTRLAARLLKEEERDTRLGPLTRWRAARFNRRLARVDFAALLVALDAANESHEAAAGLSVAERVKRRLFGRSS